MNTKIDQKISLSVGKSIQNVEILISFKNDRDFNTDYHDSSKC
jgi:hypothetical protein